MDQAGLKRRSTLGIQKTGSSGVACKAQCTVCMYTVQDLLHSLHIFLSLSIDLRVAIVENWNIQIREAAPSSDELKQYRRSLLESCLMVNYISFNLYLTIVQEQTNRKITARNCHYTLFKFSFNFIY